MVKVELELEKDFLFKCKNERGNEIKTDIIPKDGSTGGGPGPMEMFLMSLAGCTGIDVVWILRKKRIELEKFVISVQAERSDTKPAYYKTIHLEYILKGNGLTEKAVEHAISLSEEKYCSVRAMIDKEKTKITSSYTIES